MITGVGLQRTHQEGNGAVKLPIRISFGLLNVAENAASRVRSFTGIVENSPLAVHSCRKRAEQRPLLANTMTGSSVASGSMAKSAYRSDFNLRLCRSFVLV
jgi:hypothetical protein